MPKGFKTHRSSNEGSEFRICDKCDRVFEMKGSNKLCRKMLILHMKKEHGIDNFKPNDTVMWSDADDKNYSTQKFGISNEALNVLKSCKVFSERVN